MRSTRKILFFDNPAVRGNDESLAKPPVTTTRTVTKHLTARQCDTVDT